MDEEKLKQFAEENGIPLDVLKQEISLRGKDVTYTDYVTGMPERTRPDYVSGSSKIADRTRDLFNLKAEGERLKAQAEQDSAQARYDAARVAEQKAFGGGIAANIGVIAGGLMGVDLTDMGQQAQKLHEQLALTAIQEGASLKEANAFAKLAMETAGITEKQGDLEASKVEEDARLKQLEADISYEDKQIADFNKMVTDLQATNNLRTEREIKYWELDRELQFKDEERGRAREEWKRQQEILWPLEQQLKEYEVETAKWDAEFAKEVAQGRRDTSGDFPDGGSVVDYSGYQTILRDLATPAAELFGIMSTGLASVGMDSDRVSELYDDPKDASEKEKRVLIDIQSKFFNTFNTLNNADSSIRKVAMEIAKKGGPRNNMEQILLRKYEVIARYAAMADMMGKDIEKEEPNLMFLRFFGDQIGKGDKQSLEKIRQRWFGLFDLTLTPENVGKEMSQEELQDLVREGGGDVEALFGEGDDDDINLDEETEEILNAEATPTETMSSVNIDAKQELMKRDINPIYLDNTKKSDTYRKDFIANYNHNIDNYTSEQKKLYDLKARLLSGQISSGEYIEEFDRMNASETPTPRSPGSRRITER